MRIFRQRDQVESGFERPEGMPEALYRLLVKRGIGSAEEARMFLRPTVNMLNPPEALPGIAKARDMLKAAVAEGKRICVYGDYDVDGVSASSIMYLCLRRMGGDADVYLPSRHEEGYGLNERALREIAQKYDLMVTVDCGITSVELIDLANELGLVTIVTDHHRPAETLPRTTVINPLVGDYPDKYLCGAGVAFKLCEALIGREEALDYVDIAALATVADIVPLMGENRVITRLGLDKMNRMPRLGLAALRDVAGLGDKPFTSGMLGFQIGPRLNASGRLGSARRAYELLITDNPGRARELAVELNAENDLRRQIEAEISGAALSQLENFDFIKHRAIVIAGEGWNSGVIGLAASRIVEMYNYPTILISMDGDVGVGSCRSIPGVDIHAALTAVAGRMVKFGGHAQAAGLTIRREELDAFREELDEYLRRNIPPETYIPVTEYDTDAEFRELDVHFVTLMEAFAPTGMGNPTPVFHSRVKVAEARRVGRDGAHLSLRLTDGTNYMRAVAFREGRQLDGLSRELEIVYAPKINEFGGRSTVELELKAISPLGGTETLMNGDNDVILAPFLTEVLYNKTYAFSDGKRLSRAALSEKLETSPQGTLVIAADAAAIAGLGGADVYVGRFPDDPRAFNAVCIMPAGEIPRGYTEVVYAGMPACGGWKLEAPRAAWAAQLPGIAEMRRAYVAVKRLLSRPVGGECLADYARSLADECRLSEICLMACLLIFLDMGLVEDAGGFRLRMGEFRKLDPDSSAAYRAAQKFKEEV